MAAKYIKNIDFATVLPLAEQVSYQPGQIVSRTLAQNKALSLTLFAFDKGEEISSHASDGDAMVICLDGTGRITIDGEQFLLHAGETIVMPSQRPHAVFAAEQFKMLLVVVFPKEK
jgi:quercetin dioxygenase-like cupin family protein